MFLIGTLSSAIPLQEDTRHQKNRWKLRMYDIEGEDHHRAPDQMPLTVMLITDTVRQAPHTLEEPKEITKHTLLADRCTGVLLPRSGWVYQLYKFLRFNFLFTRLCLYIFRNVQSLLLCSVTPLARYALHQRGGMLVIPTSPRRECPASCTACKSLHKAVWSTFNEPFTHTWGTQNSLLTSNDSFKVWLLPCSGKVIWLRTSEMLCWSLPDCFIFALRLWQLITTRSKYNRTTLTVCNVTPLGRLYVLHALPPSPSQCHKHHISWLLNNPALTFLVDSSNCTFDTYLVLILHPRWTPAPHNKSILYQEWLTHALPKQCYPANKLYAIPLALSRSNMYWTS